jgi:hypothetical protein
VWCTLAVVAAFVPWRWIPALDLPPPPRAPAPPIAHAPSPPTEHAPTRVPVAPPRPTTPRLVTIADEVVVRALDPGRAAFLGCWARARKAEPLFDPVKIKLHVEIDETGRVVSVTHDAALPKLGACLVFVAKSLVFAPPGQPAAADIPLFFRPD